MVSADPLATVCREEVIDVWWNDDPLRDRRKSNRVMSGITSTSADDENGATEELGRGGEVEV